MSIYMVEIHQKNNLSLLSKNEVDIMPEAAIRRAKIVYFLKTKSKDLVSRKIPFVLFNVSVKLT